ncbi:MAG: tRNA (adenosine(37)-N6)-threonylcarbamoyltransferase complex dimerization subunit type 1 TsaB [Neisseriaceae bacterium]|nr:tRNA (adenosine(37)-N6)-threonylcarbamoyltransferase complex dimerization subunit type 1 TsaB [Neisseriaceae bacterium]
MIADFNRPILSIDSGTNILSIALRIDGQTFSIVEDMGNRQSEYLLPKLTDLLKEANTQIQSLSAIIYNQGPGMFTGLRIGIAVAQGLSAPFDIPLIGVPSLDAAAFLIQDSPYVLAAIDARMNEVFYAFFDMQQKQRISEYRVDKVENITLPENINPDNIQGIGNGFTKDICNISGILTMPCANDFINCASWGNYPAHDANKASLLYVRDKVALTVSEQLKNNKKV